MVPVAPSSQVTSSPLARIAVAGHIWNPHAETGSIEATRDGPHLQWASGQTMHQQCRVLAPCEANPAPTHRSSALVAVCSATAVDYCNNGKVVCRQSPVLYIDCK